MVIKILLHLLFFISLQLENALNIYSNFLLSSTSPFISHLVSFCDTLNNAPFLSQKNLPSYLLSVCTQFFPY